MQYRPYSEGADLAHYVHAENVSPDALDVIAQAAIGILKLYPTISDARRVVQVADLSGEDNPSGNVIGLYQDLGDGVEVISLDDDLVVPEGPSPFRDFYNRHIRHLKGLTDGQKKQIVKTTVHEHTHAVFSEMKEEFPERVDQVDAAIGAVLGFRYKWNAHHIPEVQELISTMLVPDRYDSWYGSTNREELIAVGMTNHLTSRILDHRRPTDLSHAIGHAIDSTMRIDVPGRSEELARLRHHRDVREHPMHAFLELVRKVVHHPATQSALEPSIAIARPPSGRASLVRAHAGLI